MSIIKIKHHNFGEERTINTEQIYSYLGEMGVSEDLIKRQVKLEHTAYEQGESRFLKNLLRDIKSERVAMNSALSRPFNWMLDRMSASLEERYAEQEAKTGNQKRESWYPYVSCVNSAALANLVCSKVLSMAVSKVWLGTQTVITEVGKAIEKECRASVLVQSEAVEWDRRYAKAMDERRSDKNRYEFLKRVELHQIAEGNIIPWKEWIAEEHAMVGYEMIKVLQQCTGLFVEESVSPYFINQRRTFSKNDHTVSALAINPEWLQRINDSVFEASVGSIKYPMLVPPKPWANVLEGGYWTSGSEDAALISTFRRNILNHHKTSRMPMVLDAVNIIQNTAWKVNPFILDVMNTLLDNDEVGQGFNDPTKGNIVWPPKEPPVTTRLPDSASAEDLKAHKKEMFNLFKKDEKRKSQRREIETGVEHARLLKTEERLFLPCYLDFRSRLYATPTLNQQKGDFVKSLLMFSDKKPVGERGWFWMRIACATLGGYDGMDKATLEARDAWFYENVGRIIQVGFSPFSDSDFWMSADKPMLFLGMCHEIAQAMTGSQKPEEYECGMPINFDGSCSGLQHYSAMLRDEVGGKEVNLIPSETYQDVYTVVKDKTFAQVKADISNIPDESDVKATDWRQRAMKSVQFMNERFDRKHMAKPPVMTFCYSANHGTFMDQFRERVQSWYAENDPEVNWGEQNYYLAKTVETATRDTVIKAGECMDWLMELTKAMMDNGQQAMEWTTPDGYTLIHEYLDTTPVTFNLRFNKPIIGEGGRVTIKREKAPKVFLMSCDGEAIPRMDNRAKEFKPERRLSSKQISAVAPNFIHSMDATHLRMTVRACYEKGITSFSLIHDSFGVMPADAQVMFDTVREQFVKLYDDDAPDMLEQIDNYVKARLPEEVYAKLTPRPSKGNLDLQGVLKSTYAFL